MFVTLYFILGYLHAKRRIRRGLAPLAYHRVCALSYSKSSLYLTSSQFLLSRKDRAQYDPRYRDSLPDYFVHRPEQYGMHAYPPPVYDPNAPAPPKYQPPAGATKLDPSQTGPANNQPTPGEPSPEYMPPPGPPPAAALHANHTGSSSTSNNPYRQ